MQNVPAAQTFAAHCDTCDCTIHVVIHAGGKVGCSFEYEEDGYTPSTIRHICWPRDERVGRLILARREAAKLNAAA